MNAIRFLKQEHEKAKGMFQQIEQAQAQQRGSLWNSLKPELTLHEQMEERHLYGPVAEDGRIQDPTLRDWKEHHHQEVQQAEAMIEEIGRLNPTDAQWLDKVRALKSTLEHHIQEEEQRIWPKIEQAWDQSKLDQAGSQMEAMKQESARRAA